GAPRGPPATRPLTPLAEGSCAPPGRVSATYHIVLKDNQWAVGSGQWTVDRAQEQRVRYGEGAGAGSPEPLVAPGGAYAEPTPFCSPDTPYGCSATRPVSCLQFRSR